MALQDGGGEEAAGFPVQAGHTDTRFAVAHEGAFIVQRELCGALSSGSLPLEGHSAGLRGVDLRPSREPCRATGAVGVRLPQHGRDGSPAVSDRGHSEGERRDIQGSGTGR